MTNPHSPSQLAFFRETVQGTGPANGAAWVAAVAALTTGGRLRHVGESLDMSGVEQQVVPDERSQITVFGGEYDVKGLRNTSFPMSIYGTGSGTTTAGASQIAATGLSTLLEHCLGGAHRSNSTTLAGGGHTTTTINVAAATNIVHGCLIAVEDVSDGTIAVRRVLDVNTLAVVLDEVLPFTPADGDLVHGMITLYVDESVLSDSRVGPTTWSWLVQKGLSPTENFEFNGCKTELKSLDLTRGTLPVLQFETMAASFDPPGTAPEPTWAGATIHGFAPVSIGPDSVWTYQTQGTTALNPIQVSESSVQVGVPAVAVDTNTEVDDGMEGRQGYSTAPAETLINLSTPDFSSTPWTQFGADTYKRIRFYKRANEGQIFAVHFSRCTMKPPKRGTAGPVSAAVKQFRALPDADNAEAANADLWTSKILIGIG